jgi:hypothetical protein
VVYWLAMFTAIAVGVIILARELWGFICDTSHAEKLILLMAPPLCGAPLLKDLIDISRLESGASLQVSSFNLPVLLVFVGGCGYLYCAVRMALRRVRAEGLKESGFLHDAPIALAAMIGGYFVWTALVHTMFFYTPHEDAGVLNAKLIAAPELAQEVGASDIQCDSATVLVKFQNEDTATYRCPTSVVFGINSSQPYVPWPHYVDGKSSTLQKWHEKLQRGEETKGSSDANS